MNMISQVEDWLAWFPEYMPRNALDPNWIFNGDESRVKLDLLDLKDTPLAKTAIQELLEM
jgi:hypothetical protein